MAAKNKMAATKFKMAACAILKPFVNIKRA